jgi:predicted ATPase
VDDESLSRLVAVTGPAGSSNVALAAAVTSVRNAAAGSCAVILVEGVSDQSAVEALAARRGRTREQQLRRFMGSRAGRKIHYGQVLADALDLTRVPRPLDRVLTHVWRNARR